MSCSLSLRFVFLFPRFEVVLMYPAIPWYAGRVSDLRDLNTGSNDEPSSLPTCLQLCNHVKLMQVLYYSYPLPLSFESYIV